MEIARHVIQPQAEGDTEQKIVLRRSDFFPDKPYVVKIQGNGEHEVWWFKDEAKAIRQYLTLVNTAVKSLNAETAE